MSLIMNKVVHFEIPSEDRKRASDFYSSVFGWDVHDHPLQEDKYVFAITSPVDENFMVKEPGGINGGIVQRDDTVKYPVITIDVPSIDEYIPKLEKAGGRLLGPKGEVPGMGFYAYFRDTEGNTIGLWENL